jgi:uncharacterized membrane-anchored protein
MRKAIALAAGLAVLAFVNFGIYQREQLVTGGRLVLLKLSPIDPRSLIQGDYMRLNFEAADQAFPFRSRPSRADGHVVVALDGQGVGRFRRLAGAEPLAADEVALRYRIRGGQPNFATNAYFFEEGRAGAYARAAYGEFRVGEGGEMILTGLRDARFQPLGGRSALAGAAEAR